MEKKYFSPEEQRAIIRQGHTVWNRWREENAQFKVDLREMNLSYDILYWPEDFEVTEEDLLNDTHHIYVIDEGGGNLQNVNLSDAYLINTNLVGARLDGADFHLSHMYGANLKEAQLREANFEDAYLGHVNFFKADLTGANLKGAHLEGASFVKANLTNACLDGARVYGISAWDVIKEGTSQKELIITPEGEPEITVDDLEIAQLVYLLLNNQKFRNVIESITSKAVLILGRFSEERKPVLDAIRDELRNRNFLPILFDFEKPATRDLTETISILAKLSRFVIADLTDAKSIPQELSHIIPYMPSLPVIPLILKEQREYGMYEHWPRYPWVLPIYEYENEAHLIATLAVGVIEPAERKVQEIRKK